VRVRGYAPLAAAVCLLLPIAACDSDDKPSTLPTVRPSSSSSPTLSPQSSVVRAAQAEEAVQAFYARADRLSHGIGDVSTLRSLYRETCIPCSSSYVAISQLRSKNQTVVGNDHVVTVLGSNVASQPGNFTVTASISTRPGRIVDSSGRVLKTSPGVPAHDWIFEVDSATAVAVIISATSVTS
jgi:hypothetical protein